MNKWAIRLLGLGICFLSLATPARAQLSIVVSTEARKLWAIQGKDTLLSAPITVGMDKSFSYAGKSWYFATPRGTRPVLAKIEKPVWHVPVWQYYEEAKRKNLEVIQTNPNDRYAIKDGYMDYIRVSASGVVSYTNYAGNSYAFDPEHYIEVGNKLYVPPLTSPQRKVSGALGPMALDLGDGYKIHGTTTSDANQIGQAVSHGCIRLANDDLQRLYAMVPSPQLRKTLVRIY